MTIKLYNTLSRKKEPLSTTTAREVRMYVCGPTVYDSCHIGHARSVVVFDVIYRYMRSAGYDVTYVRNFTDVDDKIIKKATDLNVDPVEIAEKYIAEFNEDMELLKAERPTFEPKATEHITDIISVIEKLIEKNYAYEVDGDVYFEVERFPQYGKLSGRKLEDMEAGARVDIDKRKRNPFDFSLWKSSKPGEPSWESPWGEGRPGWHIECTAMSTRFLGNTFDIHGGGKDLIFPHHENEIAQSECAFGKSFATFWVHNGFVNINKEKMSKSLGNFLMVKDALKLYHPEAIRLFLLSKHYRSPIDFTDKSMEDSISGLDKIYTLLERLENQNLNMLNENNGNPDAPETPLWKSFKRAMEDDFNTAKGIGILFEAVRDINRMLDENQTETISADWLDMMKIGNILGILGEDPRAYFEAKKTAGLDKKSVDKEWIEKMIQDRNEARKAKDFAKADSIRDELKSMNIILEDRPEGTTWNFG